MEEEKYAVSDAPSVLLKDYTVKPLFSKKGVDIVITVFLVLLSILGVSALFWNSLSLGYTLVFNAAIILISAFLIKKRGKLSISFMACGILSVICSLSFFMTSNIAVKVISLFATAGSAIIWFTAAAGKNYYGGDYGLIVYFFTAVYNAISDLPRVLKSIFSKGENQSKTVSNILIGIVCAIPAVLIIVPILANADDAFGSLINNIFDDYLTLLQKIILGIGVSVFVIALVFSLKYNDKEYKVRDLSVKVNNTSLSAFLSVLCFVYIVYLFSQLAYFFSAFSSILPSGYKFTYAQYARRGFFELCIIAVINLMFIFAAVLISEKKQNKISVAVKLPSAFIVFFTFVIIFTALSKMIMYIGVYGCTVLRICTSAFMLWLFALFIFLLIRIFIKQFDFLKSGLISALVILTILGIGNVNARIAKYNYNAYKDGKLKMDVVYMSKLGDEGVPYLYKLTKDKDGEIAIKAAEALNDKYASYFNIDFNDTAAEVNLIPYEKFYKYEKTYGSFGEYSLPKARAYKTLYKFAKEQKCIYY